jgi:ComF family protein
LPYSYYSNQENNPIHQIFYGKTLVRSATSLFVYDTKGIIQAIIHEWKYKDHEDLGKFLGNLLALELSNSNQFIKIDYIIPVPLHPTKLKKRGYNQLSKLGQTLSESLKIPYLENLLLKTSGSDTQTKKNKFDRWKNAQELFQLTDIKRLENKNILLVDDVITTGATLEACAKELNKTKNISISVATIAHTINF